MKKVILIIAIVLLLTGCAEENKKCIESHTERGTCVRYQPIYTGKTVQIIPFYYPCDKTICDKYEVSYE